MYNYKIRPCCPRNLYYQYQMNRIITSYERIFLMDIIRCDTCFFSVWLNTGSYSADINGFRSHTGNNIENLITYSVNVKSKLTKRGYGRAYLSYLCSSCAPRLFYYLGSVIVDINFTTLFIVEKA